MPRQGIRGLWEAIHPAGTERFLNELAASGFAMKGRLYCIGVDADIWISRLEHRKDRWMVLLKSLYQLAQYPISFVFVAQDEVRATPGKKADLRKEFREIVEAFGMEWRTADAEYGGKIGSRMIRKASAELGYLNYQNRVDAVLTDDSDVFIFGAHTVIENFDNVLFEIGRTETSTGTVRVYSARALEQVVHLTRGGLVLIGMIHRWNNDKSDSNMIDMDESCKLAQCGFGDQLLKPTKPMELREWSAKVQAKLNQLFAPAAAPKLGADFPHARDLQKYICRTPITSSPSIGDRFPKRPEPFSIPDIAAFFGKHSESKTWDAELLKVIWLSPVIQLLCRMINDPVRPDGGDETLVLRHLVGQDHHRHCLEDPTPLIVRIAPNISGNSEYRVDISLKRLVALLDLGLRSVPTSVLSSPIKAPDVLQLWIPSFLISRTHPQLTPGSSSPSKANVALHVTSTSSPKKRRATSGGPSDTRKRQKASVKADVIEIPSDSDSD
ncbi:hypothetical protein C8J56DRAFT_927563 [Mycena floridula]|nr:hypothetical protein C8J56DRAFT_927563 [Mycena floridula]